MIDKIYRHQHSTFVFKNHDRKQSGAEPAPDIAVPSGKLPRFLHLTDPGSILDHLCLQNTKAELVVAMNFIKYVSNVFSNNIYYYYVGSQSTPHPRE